MGGGRASALHRGQILFRRSAPCMPPFRSHMKTGLNSNIWKPCNVVFGYFYLPCSRGRSSMRNTCMPPLIFRANSEHLIFFPKPRPESGLEPQSQGQNLALTVSCVPYSEGSRLPCSGSTSSEGTKFMAPSRSNMKTGLTKREQLRTLT